MCAPPNTACSRPPIMPELGVNFEDGRFGGWRRLTPGRWAAVY